MKKYLVLLGVILASATMLTSCFCDTDDNSGNPGTPAGPGTLPGSVFVVSGPGASFTTGSIPSATTTTTVADGSTGFSYNSSALAGGSNFINFYSPVNYSKFYIGAQGYDGYYVVDADPTQVGDLYYYQIPVDYSTNFDQNTVMILAAEDVDGNVTKPYQMPVTYVADNFSGDLNINLTFSNAKDVDLHLFLPDETHIYFGNRGGTTNNGNAYGLDKDSNPGCNIDNLNNENIHIPAELIQTGEYRIVVDLFSNCDASIATSWQCVARYRGEVINVTEGANPATGVYPVGAHSGDMTVVMKFTLQGNNVRAVANNLKRYTPIQPTESDLSKMELLKWMKK